ncbi:MAG: protein kinase [Microscillaceae bacterium]|jgi:serine/threonine protein kinase|nr:protein kinase [Microscillaceae bacterium]
MPFFEKGSLRTLLNEFKTKNLIFTPKSTTAIILLIAQAMQYAHSKGTIHRDLKPENILFDGFEPIIADWGIGKFIHYQSVVLTNKGIGTQGYCSPEQWNNSNLTNHRTDIYALGIIFREVLTGSIDGHIQDNRLRNIVINMTNQNPNDRYQSMQEVINAIYSLNTVSANPQNDFWEDVGRTSLVLGSIVLGGVLLGEVLNAVFKK